MMSLRQIFFWFVQLSPYGACPSCAGLGVIEEITEESVMPNKKVKHRTGRHSSSR